MTTMTGGEAVARSLAVHGVELVFGIPGTHNLEIYAHLPGAGIRQVNPRHEQGAAYAADGYARVTGRPGVCVVTSGPATLNAAAAIGQAYSDSVPVLLISPGMPLRHPGRGNGLLHETKDQRAALDAVAAYSHRVTSVGEIPVAVAQAFAALTCTRPRPVHLEIPLDVLAEREDVVLTPPIVITRRQADGTLLAEAAEVLARASKPGIIVGGGARSASPQVAALAERLGAPVISTANGKGVLAEDHPLSLGAGLHLSAVRDFVKECDALLVIGSELAPSDLWAGPLPEVDRLIRIDIDPAQLVTNVVAYLGLACDAAAGLEGLLARIQTGSSSTMDVSRAARWRAECRRESAVEGAEWLWVVESLAEALGRDGVVATDSAMVAYYGALANLPAYRPASFLYPTGYGTLGYGLPAAIGAKLARPDDRVLALLGDGGIMFTVAELATAAQLGLSLPIVVVDNAGYGEIRREMTERNDPVQAVDLPSPDFVGLAQAMGCDGIQADNAHALRKAVDRAFDAKRPTVVHVRIECEVRECCTSGAHHL